MIRVLCGRSQLVSARQQLTILCARACQLSTTPILSIQPSRTDMKMFGSKKGSEFGSTHYSLFKKVLLKKKRPRKVETEPAKKTKQAPHLVDKMKPSKRKVYTEEDLDVKETHHPATKIHEYLALFAVRCMRTGFDLVSRYKGPGGKMTKDDWLYRCIFLETVAGIPGMVAGMHRHLKSLGSKHRDHGWIPILFEEAENERMHLLIFLSMKQPGRIFRVLVTLAQGIFFNAFFVAYWISPRTCHRFVGYLEEEAVHTYTGFVRDLQTVPALQKWANQELALIGRNYYKLPTNATILDVVRCIRTDESHHRDVNHTFANMTKLDDNPFLHGKHMSK